MAKAKIEKPKKASAKPKKKAPTKPKAPTKLLPGASGSERGEFPEEGETPEVPPKLAPKGEKKEKEEPEVKGDYLRQYQFKKEMKLGAPETDPSKNSKAARMKASLLKQPKVRMFIPRDQGESRDIKLSVTLNGYRLDFPKQTYISVPEQIADVIMASQEQTEEAGRPLLIDRDKGTEEALS